jgi:hypothetical protein
MERKMTTATLYFSVKFNAHLFTVVWKINNYKKITVINAMQSHSLSFSGKQQSSDAS